MRRLWLLALACALASSAGNAQSTLTITVVSTETGERIPNALLLLNPGMYQQRTDEGGRAQFHDLRAGSYTLTVTKEGFDDYGTSLDLGPGARELEIPLLLMTVRIPGMEVSAMRATERTSPVTFTELSSADINRRRILEDAPQILSWLPSTTFYSESGNGLGYSFLSLRGFDQRRLAIMVNGIPQNDPEDHNVYWIDMPDLLAYTEDIQVQRGAGSAFYGPPAIGGSINIVTTPHYIRPRVVLGTSFGFQEFGGENRIAQNTRRSGIFVHSGLVDGRYMMYGNLSTTRSSGYRLQAWTELSSYFLGAAYFGSTSTVRFHAYGGPLSDGLSYIGIPKTYNSNLELRRTNFNYFEMDSTGENVGFSVTRKPREREEFFQPHYELLHEWRVTPSIRLHNTIFFIQGDGYFDYDGDWVWYDNAATNWFRRYAGFDSTFGDTRFPSMLIRGFVANRQWGWLPRARFEHSNGILTVGAEIRVHRSNHWGKLQESSIYPAGYDFDMRFYNYDGGKDILSFYAHEMYRVGESTSLMGNIQVVHNRYMISNEQFLKNDFSLPYLFVNPRAGINHNFTEELNGYFAAGFTSREPRLRNLYAAEDAWFGAKPQFEGSVDLDGARYDFTKPLAKPEQLLDFELGGAYTGTAGRVSLSLYWMEFTDELVKQGTVDIFGNPVTGNAERTRHVGLELDGRIEPFRHFDIAGNISLSRNRHVRYRVFDAATGEFVSLDGNQIPGFPDFLANLRSSYRMDNLYLALQMKHVGRMYTDSFENELHSIDSYTIFDFDASYTLPYEAWGVGITLRTRVNNIFNSLYLASGEGNSFFPGAERNYVLDISMTL